MSSIITQTCDGYTVTLQIEILSVEKGGEKESEKKVTQRKEKEKDLERESLAGPLSRIAEAWSFSLVTFLPSSSAARFSSWLLMKMEVMASGRSAVWTNKKLYNVSIYFSKRS